MSKQSEVKFTPDSPILTLLGIEPHDTPANGEVCCSFCGEPVEVFNGMPQGSRGSGPLKRKIEYEPVRNSVSGEIVSFTEVVKFTSQKLVACSRCCLSLTPKMEKCSMCKGKDILKLSCKYCGGSGEGRIVSQGVKFPEFD